MFQATLLVPLQAQAQLNISVCVVLLVQGCRNAIWHNFTICHSMTSRRFLSCALQLSRSCVGSAGLRAGLTGSFAALCTKCESWTHYKTSSVALLLTLLKRRQIAASTYIVQQTLSARGQVAFHAAIPLDLMRSRSTLKRMRRFRLQLWVLVSKCQVFITSASLWNGALVQHRCPSNPATKHSSFWRTLLQGLHSIIPPHQRSGPDSCDSRRSNSVPRGQHFQTRDLHPALFATMSTRRRTGTAVSHKVGFLFHEAITMNSPMISGRWRNERPWLKKVTGKLQLACSFFN